VLLSRAAWTPSIEFRCRRDYVQDVRSKGNWWLLLGLAAAALAAAAGAGVAGAAVASGPKEKEARLTGSSIWSTAPVAYALSGRIDGNLGHGTYTGTLTAGSSVFTTPTCGPVCADVTGSLTMSTHGGRFTAVVEPGGVVSIEDIASRSFRDFTLQLRIVSGTGRFAHKTGLLSLTYSSVWTHTYVNGVYVDKIEDTGTLVGRVH
jgi:hypothetical protein